MKWTLLNSNYNSFPSSLLIFLSQNRGDSPFFQDYYEKKILDHFDIIKVLVVAGTVTQAMNIESRSYKPDGSDDLGDIDDYRETSCYEFDLILDNSQINQIPEEAIINLSAGTISINNGLNIASEIVTEKVDRAFGAAVERVERWIKKQIKELNRVSYEKLTPEQKDRIRVSYVRWDIGDESRKPGWKITWNRKLGVNLEEAKAQVDAIAGPGIAAMVERYKEKQKDYLQIYAPQGGNESDFPEATAMYLRSATQGGSGAAPSAKINSLLSRMSNKFFLPEFLSCFADMVNNLLFGHPMVRGMDFRHYLTDLLKSCLGFSRLFFHGISPLNINILSLRRYVKPLIISVFLFTIGAGVVVAVGVVFIILASIFAFKYLKSLHFPLKLGNSFPVGLETVLASCDFLKREWQIMIRSLGNVVNMHFFSKIFSSIGLCKASTVRSGITSYVSNGCSSEKRPLDKLQLIERHQQDMWPYLLIMRGSEEIGHISIICIDENKRLHPYFYIREEDRRHGIATVAFTLFIDWAKAKFPYAKIEIETTGILSSRKFVEGLIRNGLVDGDFVRLKKGLLLTNPEKTVSTLRCFDFLGPLVVVGLLLEHLGGAGRLVGIAGINVVAILAGVFLIGLLFLSFGKAVSLRLGSPRGSLFRKGRHYFTAVSSRLVMRLAWFWRMDLISVVSAWIFLIVISNNVTFSKVLAWLVAMPSTLLSSVFNPSPNTLNWLLRSSTSTATSLAVTVLLFGLLFFFIMSIILKPYSCSVKRNLMLCALGPMVNLAVVITLALKFGADVVAKAWQWVVVAVSDELAYVSIGAVLLQTTSQRKWLLLLTILLLAYYSSSLGSTINPIAAIITIAAMNTILNSTFNFTNTSPTKIAMALPLNISINAVPKAFLLGLVKNLSSIKKNIAFALMLVKRNLAWRTLLRIRIENGLASFVSHLSSFAANSRWRVWDYVVYILIGILTAVWAVIKYPGGAGAGVGTGGIAVWAGMGSIGAMVAMGFATVMLAVVYCSFAQGEDTEGNVPNDSEGDNGELCSEYRYYIRDKTGKLLKEPSGFPGYWTVVVETSIENTNAAVERMVKSFSLSAVKAKRQDLLIGKFVVTNRASEPDITALAHGDGFIIKHSDTFGIELIMQESFLLLDISQQRELFLSAIETMDAVKATQPYSNEPKITISRNRPKIVIFSNPFIYSLDGGGRGYSSLSSWALALAGLLKANGFDDVAISDFIYNPRKSNLIEISEILSDADYVCVSVGEHNLESHKKFIADVRKANPGIVIVAGGFGVTVIPEHVIAHLPEVNIFYRGEAEAGIVHLFNATKDLTMGNVTPEILAYYLRGTSGVMTHYGDIYQFCSLLAVNRMKCQEFNDRIFDFSFLHEENVDGSFSFMTNLGCDGNCVFCLKVGGSGYRVMSPERIIEIAWSYQRRLEEIEKEGGVVSEWAWKFAFSDDNFLGNHEAALKTLHLWQQAQQQGLKLKLPNIQVKLLSLLTKDPNDKLMANEELIKELASFKDVFYYGKVQLLVGTEDVLDHEIKRLGKGKYTIEHIEQVAALCSKYKIINEHYLILTNPKTRIEDLVLKLIRAYGLYVKYCKYEDKTMQFSMPLVLAITPRICSQVVNKIVKEGCENLVYNVYKERKDTKKQIAGFYEYGYFPPGSVIFSQYMPEKVYKELYNFQYQMDLHEVSMDIDNYIDTYLEIIFEVIEDGLNSVTVEKDWQVYKELLAVNTRSEIENWVSRFGKKDLKGHVASIYEKLETLDGKFKVLSQSTIRGAAWTAACATAVMAAVAVAAFFIPVLKVVAIAFVLTTAVLWLHAYFGHHKTLAELAPAQKANAPNIWNDQRAIATFTTWVNWRQEIKTAWQARDRNKLFALIFHETFHGLTRSKSEILVCALEIIAVTAVSILLIILLALLPVLSASGSFTPASPIRLALGGIKDYAFSESHVSQLFGSQDFLTRISEILIFTILRSVPKALGFIYSVPDILISIVTSHLTMVSVFVFICIALIIARQWKRSFLVKKLLDESKAWGAIINNRARIKLINYVKYQRGYKVTITERLKSYISLIRHSQYHLWIIALIAGGALLSGCLFFNALKITPIISNGASVYDASWGAHILAVGYGLLFLSLYAILAVTLLAKPVVSRQPIQLKFPFEILPLPAKEGWALYAVSAGLWKRLFKEESEKVNYKAIGNSPGQGWRRIVQREVFGFDTDSWAGMSDEARAEIRELLSASRTVLIRADAQDGVPFVTYGQIKKVFLSPALVDSTWSDIGDVLGSADATEEYISACWDSLLDALDCRAARFMLWWIALTGPGSYREYIINELEELKKDLGHKQDKLLKALVQSTLDMIGAKASKDSPNIFSGDIFIYAQGLRDGHGADEQVIAEIEAFARALKDIEDFLLPERLEDCPESYHFSAVDPD
ncbi:MAG: hypothetical protein NTX01_04455, partial [Candidatus Omnitrophica bacterium]|nr:hypothetical protein [Candidatus Omnitrophota bacterium]